jgi:hypothetical protein
LFYRDDVAPEKCPQCGFDGTVKSTSQGNQDGKTDEATPEVERLLTCKNCGQKFDPKNPGGCSYHPQEAKWIGGTGPRDESDKYIFPCCGLEYDGYEHKLSPSDSPPQSPGCSTGNHTP